MTFNIWYTSDHWTTDWFKIYDVTYMVYDIWYIWYMFAECQWQPTRCLLIQNNQIKSNQNLLVRLTCAWAGNNWELVILWFKLSAWESARLWLQLWTWNIVEIVSQWYCEPHLCDIAIVSLKQSGIVNVNVIVTVILQQLWTCQCDCDSDIAIVNLSQREVHYF